jgi:flagella synthesis protein FlgN
MTAVTSDSALRVTAALRDETALLQDFIAVLSEEQAALAEDRLDDLMPLANRKSDLSARLADTDDQRLKSIGLGAGDDPIKAMSVWLQAHPDTGDLASAWQAVLDLAAKARDLNTLNGKLIAQRMHHNQQALAILMAARDAAALYGPDGQPRLGGTGRSLGSA